MSRQHVQTHVETARSKITRNRPHAALLCLRACQSGCPQRLLHFCIFSRGACPGRNSETLLAKTSKYFVGVNLSSPAPQDCVSWHSVPQCRAIKNSRQTNLRLLRECVLGAHHLEQEGLFPPLAKHAFSLPPSFLLSAGPVLGPRTRLVCTNHWIHYFVGPTGEVWSLTDSREAHPVGSFLSLKWLGKNLPAAGQRGLQETASAGLAATSLTGAWLSLNAAVWGRGSGNACRLDPFP
jgi:hypothetical protein